MNRHGLLLTLTEPPPQMAEEFNAWYDREHIPERLSIPGFRSARRWVAHGRPGEGKYLATYELDSPAVLASPAYLAFFERPSPWTQRCLSKAVVFKRWACEQIDPGQADPQAAAKAIALVCRDAPTSPLALPGALSARHFAASSGEPRHIALFELAGTSARDIPAGWGARLYQSYTRISSHGA
jgi:hypothetical protein